MIENFILVHKKNSRRFNFLLLPLCIVEYYNAVRLLSKI